MEIVSTIAMNGRPTKTPKTTMPAPSAAGPCPALAGAADTTGCVAAGPWRRGLVRSASHGMPNAIEIITTQTAHAAIVQRVSRLARRSFGNHQLPKACQLLIRRVRAGLAEQHVFEIGSHLTSKHQHPLDGFFKAIHERYEQQTAADGESSMVNGIDAESSPWHGRLARDTRLPQELNLKL